MKELNKLNKYIILKSIVFQIIWHKIFNNNYK